MNRQFSIILPVRNGGNYIASCISAILSQTCPDFELLILENQSTDNTLALIQSFQDERIRIFPAERDLTIEENWARITEIPKAPYITLIGHDDLLDPGYLTEMKQLIREQPAAGLYQTHFRYIDSKGSRLRSCNPMQTYYSPEQAISGFLEDKINLMGTGFMMRSETYDRAGGIPPYPALLFADMEIFIRLAAAGGLAVSPKELFGYRIHPQATTSISSDRRFFAAFEQLVHFLADFSVEHPELRDSVRKGSSSLLDKYCQGITHKILKTAKSQRDSPSVAEAITAFRNYGQLLTDGAYDPRQNRSVRLGAWIDRRPFWHRMFLEFKKIYKKPVL
ncbi:hypothetical protein GCM10027051_14180 [Niabella terrae]